ncbi:MAG: hypothetical protein WDO71_10965 [Bacteroidota bacterium]
MQSATHTFTQKNSYSPVVTVLPPVTNSLRVVDRSPAVKEFNNICQYHTQVMQHLAGLKAVAEVSGKEKAVYQEEFICVSMQAISRYSMLLTDTVSRIAAAGLKNYSSMILSGTSLFLGGDAEGGFFQTAVAITDEQFKNRNNLFRLTAHTERKEDHGLYTGFIQELLGGLKSFCHDHPLYKKIIKELSKAD